MCTRMSFREKPKQLTSIDSLKHAKSSRIHEFVSNYQSISPFKMKGKWMHNVHQRLATHLSCTSQAEITKEVYRCRPWELYHSTKRNKIPGMFPYFVLPSCLLQNGYISSQTYNGKPIILYRDSESRTVKPF